MKEIIDYLELLLLGDDKEAFFARLSRLVEGDETILDLGAGSGRISLRVARLLNEGELICLDSGAQKLDRLREKARRQGVEDRIRLIQSGASSTKLDKASVDICICNQLLHEVRNPTRVLEEIHRVLKPEGWLLTTDFRRTFLSNLFTSLGHRAEQDEVCGPLTEEEMRQLLDGTGFQHISVKAIKHKLFAAGKKPSAK